jgi:hypothetical protein
MTGPLIVALLISTAPAYMKDQQPNVAKLKADAQKVVSMIQGDTTKARVYCQINALEEQIGEADRKNDKKKAEALSKRVTELEKKLGPEYLALAVDLNNVNPNSPVGQEIDSMLASLDDSCVE